MALRTGKLPPGLLAKSIRHTGAHDRRVLLGPKLGEDAAIVRIGKDRLLVLKTDPVTYASDMIGHYAVHINANDIATRGATPAWFQAAILLPEGSDEKLPEEISRQISAACEDLGIAVVGGHTEVTPGISTPIVVGDMHGLIEGRKPVLTSGARVGDTVVLTKGAGIEGTATLARMKAAEVKRRIGPAAARRASRFLFKPGLSVIPEAKAALRFDVTAMHDPTEGGVLMGVYEMGSASGRSVELHADQVPVLPETRMICEMFGIDPLGLLGSGALLATFRPRDAERYMDALDSMGIRAAAVGRIVSGKNRSTTVRDGEVTPLASCERDELLRVS
jgi:hydrogenase expression/formation protein HypE